MAKTRSKAARLASQCRDRGFDQTRCDGGTVYPRCSQCEVCVIQGIACHEQGCPNARRVQGEA